MASAYALRSIDDVLTSGSRRADGRARLGIAARLVTFSGIRSCTVVDLSYTGACIQAEANLRMGAMVVVESEPMELFGTVRWARGGFAGFEFEHRLTLEQAIAFRRYVDETDERERRERKAYARSWVTGVY
jgi:hypothetical protein